MRTSSAVAIMLAVALIASNGWWAYRSVDRGISATYLEASYSTNTELMQQSLAVLNAIGSAKTSRDEIIRAARLGNATNEPFEKEGFVWVGQLGLRFGPQGQLLKAVAGPQEVSQ